MLRRLIGDSRSTARSKGAPKLELSALATAVCKKLSSCPRPATETAISDVSTGVLCGCLILLKSLIDNDGGSLLHKGAGILINDLNVPRWSEMIMPKSKGLFSLAKFRQTPKSQDVVLVDLMGAIFDGYLSPGGSSSIVAICCDKTSRQFGFDVVNAAARACSGGDGYIALVNRINGLIASASPHLWHRWRWRRAPSIRKAHIGILWFEEPRLHLLYHMNSLLQQLIMTTELRKSICAAPLPAVVCPSGGAATSKGAELVGKRLSMQWENGVAYDMTVEGYDEDTG